MKESLIRDLIDSKQRAEIYRVKHNAAWHPFEIKWEALYLGELVRIKEIEAQLSILNY